MCNYQNSSANLVNCIFKGNSAVINGGGVLNSSSSPSVTNCVIFGNTGQYGGGMYNYNYSSPMVSNCTFSGNTADANGGGIMSNFSNEPTVNNSILWGNLPEQIYDYMSPDSSTTVTYSDVQGSWFGAGSNNIDVDPCFVDGAGGNLRLSAGSACIDAGADACVPADTFDLDNDGNTTEPVPWDLDGRTRFADGDCNATMFVDMGAYEFSWAYLGDFDGECDVDVDDLVVLCDEWLLGELLWDVWGDGFVNFLDWSVLADGWGDRYDAFDLAEFAGEWLRRGITVADIAPYGGDGIVNMADYAVLADNWLAGK
jgi:hypothetical protein